jgi:conjugal transfer pilus assembly protein TraA
MKIKIKNKLLALALIARKKVATIRNTLFGFSVFTFSTVASASTSGTDFKTLFDWVNDALSGYLGMAIAIIATIIGLGNAALGGKMVVSLAGIGVAIIAALAPAIIDAIFNSAII